MFPMRKRSAVLLPVAVLVPVVFACSTTATAQPSSTPQTAPTSASTPSSASLAASTSATTTSAAAAQTSSVSGSATAGDSLVTAVRTASQTVRPAVVQITNQQQVQTGQFNQPFVVPAGVGSGIIYDNQGHILTNNHVVEGAQQLLVSLPDKRSLQATLVGADPQTDLAVIQVQGDNLPTAQLGDSTQLQVGDWVVAIGNALALPGGPTVTQGVVSALGRTVQEPASSPSSGTSGSGGRAASVGRVVLVANRRLLVHSCSTSFRPMRLSTQATQADHSSICRVRSSASTHWSLARPSLESRHRASASPYRSRPLDLLPTS